MYEMKGSITYFNIYFIYISTTGKQIMKLFIQITLAYFIILFLFVGGHRYLGTLEDQLASILKIEKMKISIKAIRKGGRRLKCIKDFMKLSELSRKACIVNKSPRH